ncbi:phage portal protein [Limosilactobacillus antri]|uniref:phage portal protein n=1 Tax=Limosilactobacillus antri TaxID=227943 RepID=UPI001F59F72F|nr:phage portal protein [Limosilactobacillus antri]
MSFMDLFRRKRRSLSLSSSGFSPFLVNSAGNVIVSNTITPTTALTNSDIYAIVSRIASNIAAMKLKTKSPVINKALKQPSDFINGFSFWQKVVVQMLLTGNSYVMIKRDGNNQPHGFIQIPANAVQINILNKDAGDPVTDVVYTVTLAEDNSKQFTLRSKDIFHFRCLVSGSDAQTNGYCGISPLVSLAQEADIQDNSNRLAVASLKHAIAPTYALKIPGVQVDNADKENLRKNFEASISRENQGRPIVLDQSMDVAPLQINSNVDELLVNTTFAQSQIAKAFNIPVEYLNGKGDQQSSIQMMNSLYVNALSIYIHPILSEISQKLGTDVRADLSTLSDVDHQQLISNIVALAAGKSPVLPARTAVRLLKNADALGLDDISDADLAADFASQQANKSIDDDKGDDSDEQR